MNWLKFFKFKQRYSDYNIEKLLNRFDILCYGDLYVNSGIEKEIEKIRTGEKYHYANVRANEKTIKLIYDEIKHNVLETKNKYSKRYKPKALETMLAFDNLMYAPKSDETLPDFVVRILHKDHPKFKTVEE